MSNIRQSGSALVLLAMAMLLFAAARAEADHDRNRIEQVMAGAGGNAAIQFVELKMLEDFHNCQGTAGDVNLLSLPVGVCANTGPGSSLLFFDAAGHLVSEYDFPHNTPVGQAGRSILIATAEFAALATAPSPDFIMPPSVVAGSGKVCYKSRPGTLFFVNNCLSYGSFVGSTEDFGTPAAALPTTGVVSLRRVASTPDNDNSKDFALGEPIMQNNAGALGTVTLPPSSTLAAATLPASRSVQVGGTATVFATIINAGSTLATGCGVSPITSIPASFTFQATDPADNHPIGALNAPIDIGPRAARSFVIAVAPSAPFPANEVALSFDCANTEPAPVNVGLNTLLLSASTTPVPDIVALAATMNNDGIVNIPGATGMGFFGVATSNVGAGGNITASADTGGVPLPVALSICQTNPATGACLSPAGASVTTQINAGETPTFAIFVTGVQAVPFDPAGNRAFVRFKDAGNIVRGATSVAVRTQ